MKNCRIIFAVATLSMFISCSSNSGENSAETEQPKISVAEMAEPATLTVGITGMMCPDGCAAVVQKEVLALDGVGSSNVYFGSRTGEFQYDAAIISQEEIIAVIESVNKGAYKTENPISSEDDDVPAPDTEAVEEIVDETEASV